MGSNLIGHGLIDYLFVYFMIGYAFYAGTTKPHRILYILPACLSFFFFIPMGSNLTADKLVPAIFIGTVIISKGPNYFSISNKKANSWIEKIWLLIFFSAIVGSVYSNYYADYVESPLFKTRLIVQLIGYTNYIFIFIIVRKEITKQQGINLLLKSFLVTTTILCIYGIYQYFAHQLGLPYRGIVYSASKTAFGGFQDSESLVFRVNSFANEPKRLTYFILISLIILFKYRKKITRKINGFNHKLLVAMHTTVLWLTYATSIYISIAIFLAFLILYTSLIKFNKVLFRQLLLVLILSLGAYSYKKVYFDNLYMVRVDKQLENEEVRAEVKGQEFILDNPEMFIIGFGPGIYNFALSKAYPKVAGLAEKGTFLIPFNSGLMTYLFDFGLIGLFLLSIPFIQILTNYKITVKNEFSIFILFLFCTAITLNPTPTLFFFIGAFEGVKNLEE